MNIRIPMWLYRLFRRFKKEPEIYVNQPVIERYGDREAIGQCACFEPEIGGENDGGYKMIEGSERPLFSETVKYQSEDGSVKLGKDWVI